MRYLLMTLAIAISLCLPQVSANAQTDVVEQRVRAYLDRIFAPDLDGVFVSRNGTLHRIPQPILMAYTWPSCTDKINGILDHFTAKTGIYIYTERDDLVGLFGGMNLKPNATYMEFRDFDDYLNGFGHAYIKRLFRPGEVVDVNEEIRNAFISNKPISYSGYDKNKAKPYIVSIIAKSATDAHDCDSIIKYSLFELISNFKPIDLSHEFDDLDFSFIRAINDSSIDANETEDTAKEKLIVLITKELKGQKNAE